MAIVRTDGSNASKNANASKRSIKHSMTVGVANIENGNFANSALGDLWDAYQNAKRGRDTASANAAAVDNRENQDDQSQADHDYALAAMRAQSKRTRGFSKLDLAYSIDVTPDSTEYER